MYYCRDCKREFNESKKLIEPDGLDTPPYRYSEACPYCGSDDFGAVIGECGKCHCTITENDSYYEVEGEDIFFCYDCIIVH